MLCRSEFSYGPENQACSTNIIMQTTVFFKPTLYILIKCDLLVVYEDEFNPYPANVENMVS